MNKGAIAQSETGQHNDIRALSLGARFVYDLMGLDGHISCYPGALYHVWLSDEAERRHLAGERGWVGLRADMYVSARTMRELEKSGLIYFEWSDATWRRSPVQTE